MIKLFVGSLSWGTTDDTLRDFFAQCGTVVSAKVIIDKFSGRSKGFGFVEMSTDEEAKDAIEKLNGQELDGRPIVVLAQRLRGVAPRYLEQRLEGLQGLAVPAQQVKAHPVGLLGIP